MQVPTNLKMKMETHFQSLNLLKHAPQRTVFKYTELNNTCLLQLQMYVMELF